MRHGSWLQCATICFGETSPPSAIAEAMADERENTTGSRPTKDVVASWCDTIGG